MRRLAFLIFFAATVAYPQHPITFDDLASIHRIGAPQLSPDGKTIAYDASMPDLAANTSRSAVFLVPAAGGESTKIADGGGPVWSPDGKTLAYTSKSQAYLYSNNASRKVTDLPGGAGSAKWMPDGSALFFVSDIYTAVG